MLYTSILQDTPRSSSIQPLHTFCCGCMLDQGIQASHPFQLHVYIYIYIYTHIFQSILWIYLSIFLSLSIIYIYIYVCIYIYIYIDVFPVWACSNFWSTWIDKHATTLCMFSTGGPDLESGKVVRLASTDDSEAITSGDDAPSPAASKPWTIQQYRTSQIYRSLREQHLSGEEGPWEDKLSGHRVGGCRAVSAAGLHVEGSCKVELTVAAAGTKPSLTPQIKLTIQCVHTYIYIYIYIYNTYVYMCIYIYIVYVYIHICIHVYIYIYNM